MALLEYTLLLFREISYDVSVYRNFFSDNDKKHLASTKIDECNLPIQNNRENSVTCEYFYVLSSSYYFSYVHFMCIYKIFHVLDNVSCTSETLSDIIQVREH